LKLPARGGEANATGDGYRISSSLRGALYRYIEATSGCTWLWCPRFAVMYTAAHLESTLDTRTVRWAHPLG
jgi:hypothetical protein